MNINQFFQVQGIRHRGILYSISGDVFHTPAKHIAFAVNFADSNGDFNNTGGFAKKIAKYWPEISLIEFREGEPVSQVVMIEGEEKHLHAFPIHSNQEGGWLNAPILIQQCFNALIDVSDDEVIATILMGSGEAGKKFGGTLDNIAGMKNTHKTVVLYVYDSLYYEVLVVCEVTTEFEPAEITSTELEKLGKRLARRRSLDDRLLKEWQVGGLHRLISGS